MDSKVKAEEREVQDKAEARITPGTPREDALRAFQESVNQRGTIFSTDRWLLPKLTTLRKLLHDPITDDETAALLNVLFGREEMRALIAGLEYRQLSPPERDARDIASTEEFYREDIARAKGCYLYKAKPCLDAELHQINWYGFAT